MTKILLTYPPFCTPTAPPYSITNLYSAIGENADVLDLNIEFHKLKFGTRFKKIGKKYVDEAKKYFKESSKIYSENNLRVVKSKNPVLFKEMLDKILKHKPDIVAFSIVYSSQAFYTYALIKKLKQLGIKTIVGGPSVSHKLIDHSKYIKDVTELLKYLKLPKRKNRILDFNMYELKDYFSPATVIPIKTSNSCYYKQCAFCTHHNENKYDEYPIKDIIKTIIKSNQKHFFLIDDMISKKRLLELAEAFMPLKISWTCQLHPTKYLDKKTLEILKKSGLKMVMWGIESGCNRILSLMNKMTTDVDIISKVLKDSSSVGIKNIAYIIFGFPTETKDEFLETIRFMQNNSDYIDLVSTSIFGLQSGSKVYNDLKKYGISKISEETRTILDPKIEYVVEKGLSQREAMVLRDKYKKTIDKLNKYPKMMNYFREHMLCEL